MDGKNDRQTMEGIASYVDPALDREEKAKMLGLLVLDLIDSSLPFDRAIDAEKQTAHEHDWLFVEDIRELFKCGDSKARAILRTLPAQKIGKRTAVRRKDLNSYIEKHGGVMAKWPSRR